MSNSPDRLVPAARLRPGLATYLRSPRTEGWAERRRAHLVVVVAPVRARVSRVCDAARVVQSVPDALASRRSTVASLFRSFPRKRESRAGSPLSRGRAERGLRHVPAPPSDHFRKRPQRAGILL